MKKKIPKIGRDDSEILHILRFTYYLTDVFKKKILLITHETAFMERWRPIRFIWVLIDKI